MFVRAVRHAYIRRNRQSGFMVQVLAEDCFVNAYTFLADDGRYTPNFKVVSPNLMTSPLTSG
jgi:hypothetical protein